MNISKQCFLVCEKCDSWVKLGVDKLSKKGKLVTRCVKCGHMEKLK